MHNILLELQQYYKKATPRCFGPYWFKVIIIIPLLFFSFLCDYQGGNFKLNPKHFTVFTFDL